MGTRSEAVDAGLAWLGRAQLPTGELPSYAGFLTEPVATWDPDPLNFITALGARSIGSIDSPEAAQIVDRAVAFLRTQREPDDLWRYWSRANERVEFTPPDADDTACCSMAVALRGDDTSANVAILRGLARPDGRFPTWLIPHGRPSWKLRRRFRSERRPEVVALRAQLWSDTEADPDDVDAVVNANVCRYLGPDLVLPGAVEWVASVVEAGWDSGDKWHRSPYALWASVAEGAARGITRFASLAPVILDRIAGAADDAGSVGRAIDTAMALRAVQALDGPPDLRARLAGAVVASQHGDGSWPREVVYHGGPTEVFGWASEALASAYAVGALAAEGP